MKAVRAVIFDFDLTLADTRQGIVECVNYSFARMGLPAYPAGRIIATIGISHQARFMLLADPSQQGRFQEYAALYQRRSNEVMPSMTTFYPSAPAAVRALKNRGLRLAIVSSAFRSRIELTLDRIGLRDCFDLILGYEDVPASKPDPTGLLETARRLETAPAETLYVGDHTVDAEAAQRAGMSFVAVLTGTVGEEAFAAFPHVAILRDLSELPALLDQSVSPTAKGVNTMGAGAKPLRGSGGVPQSQIPPSPAGEGDRG